MLVNLKQDFTKYLSNCKNLYKKKKTFGVILKPGMIFVMKTMGSASWKWCFLIIETKHEWYSYW